MLGQLGNPSATALSRRANGVRALDHLERSKYRHEKRPPVDNSGSPVEGLGFIRAARLLNADISDKAHLGIASAGVHFSWQRLKVAAGVLGLAQDCAPYQPRARLRCR